MPMRKRKRESPGEGPENGEDGRGREQSAYFEGLCRVWVNLERFLGITESSQLRSCQLYPSPSPLTHRLPHAQVAEASVRVHHGVGCRHNGLKPCGSAPTVQSGNSHLGPVIGRLVKVPGGLSILKEGQS
eukprot:759745-Hanusia_phi.AAC.1